MPTIPIGQRVQSSPLQGGFQSGNIVEGAFNGSARQIQKVGQATNLLAEGLDRVAVREDLDAAYQAETALKKEFIAFDLDARSKKQGRGAKGYAAEVEKWWQDAKTRTAPNLNPQARALANKSLGNAMLSHIEAASRWEVAELEKSAEASYGEAISAEIQRFVVTNDFTPGARGAAVNDIRDKINTRAALKGWTAEQVAQETTRRLSEFHQRATEMLLQKDPEQAAQYLKDAVNAKELTADALTRWAPRIEEAGYVKQAEREAAKLQGMPYKEQLAAVAAVEDPKLREKMQVEVDQNFAKARRMQQAEQQGASDEAWQFVAQGKRVPEAVLSRMDGKERVQLQGHLAAKARLGAEGRSVKTNPVKLAEVYDMLREDPEGFKKLRMVSLANDIAPNDIEQIAQRQAAMNKPNAEKAVVSIAKRIDVAGDVIGAGITNTNDRAVARAGFQKYVYDQIDSFVARTGKEPTEKEVQQILDDAQLEVVTNKGWFTDTKKRVFQMSSEEREKADFNKTFGIGQPAASQGTSPRIKDKYTVGQTYRDAQGNQAKYLGNGQWQNIK